MAGKIVMALAQGRPTLAVDQLSVNCLWCWCCNISCGRNCTSTAGCRFLPSPWGFRALDQTEVSTDPSSHQKLMKQKLWSEFFSDSSLRWWDHRSEKVTSRYLKQNRTWQSLRINNNLAPTWVKAEPATVRDVSPVSGGKMMTESVLGKLFSDPFQWWDDRSENLNPRDPGFKHKTIGQSFWIIDNLTPPWGKAQLATARDVSPDSVSNRKMMREKLWREFFWDPSQWWDNRSEKVNPRYPDFKHKNTQQGLWIIDNMTPPWVEAQLATMAPGVLQSHIFSWHVRLRRLVQAGEYEETLSLFQQMQRQGIMPDKFTFVPVLSACSNLKALEEGRRVHEQILQSGCESEIYVASCLVDMYGKCGSVEDAWSVFDRMPERSVVSWNVMIAGYVKSEQGLKALELFRNMQQEGVEPDPATFVGALNACASVAGLEDGKRVHELIIQRGYDSDTYVATCLVDMYAKCGSIEEAWNVFDSMQGRDVVSWNAMIVGYVKSEQGLKALELFRKMQREGVEPNIATFVVALNACASVATLEEGRRVHKQIIQKGCESAVNVATCIVHMYAKCGSIKDAWSLFNRMRDRDVVSWSAMILGYVKSEQGLKALELFQRMQEEGVQPDAATFVGALKACAIIVALQQGRLVHKQIIKKGYESDVYVANCLIDMYAKCGSAKDAWTVFNKMRERTVTTWTAMIGGYAMHGHFGKAIELFKRMGKEGVETNEITFICLLSACSHGGLVKEGLHYFNTMTSRHNVHPTRAHYICMVDLLGRAGRLKEAERMAEEMMKRMPMENDSCVWTCLLGACRIHGNMELGERAAKRCREQNTVPDSTGVLLSNIHVESGIGVQEFKEEKSWESARLHLDRGENCGAFSSS